MARCFEKRYSGLQMRATSMIYMFMSPKRIEDAWLCVGGGNGQYLVSGAAADDDDDKFPTLIDPSKTNTRKFNLTIGGQTGDYPENYVLTLEQTLHGVKDFYETGEFSASINWAYV